MARTHAANGQVQSNVVCGRRCCVDCKRWRLVVYFSVRRWTDKHKTTPKWFKSECQTCAVRRQTERHFRADRHQENLARFRRNWHARKEQKRVESILSFMSSEERHEYELEGCLPIIARGLVLEDLDPTLIPTGCPGCWKRDGGLVCDTCPDVEAKQKRRDDIRAGRVEKKILAWA